MKPCGFSSLFKELIGEPRSFGCSFMKEKEVYHPFKAVPQGFCPALLHAIIPYFVTLWNDGWMRWVKKTKDPAIRLEIPQNASNIKNVNRLFYNEVIAQCPDPENGVVVGIGPKKDKGSALLVRVLDVKKNCPLAIAVGDAYEFRPDGQAFCLEAFHRLYPYLLLGDNPQRFPFQDKNTNPVIQCSCNRGKTDFIIPFSNQYRNNGVKSKTIRSVNCGDYKELAVSVNNIEVKCRYHNSPLTYSENQFGPLGLCLDAFHAAYPFALALLYDADFSEREKKDSITVSCPNTDGVGLLIKREKRYPAFFLKLIKFLEKIFEFFFYPVDKIYNDISLTVVSNEGGCPRQHQIDEKYFLNIRNREVMCPASFNSLFPNLVQASYGARNLEEITTFFHCPDCQGADYVLKRMRGLLY